jgi:hypothetical protein
MNESEGVNSIIKDILTKNMKKSEFEKDANFLEQM